MANHTRINKKIVEFGFEVADRTNALLAYWDKNLICRFANNSYIAWFGIEPAKMIDKMHIKDLLGELYKKNLPYIKEALKGKTQVFERDIPIASGKIRNSIATYLPDIENDEVKGFFVHVADVTYVKTKLKRADLSLQGKNNYTSVTDTMLDVEKTLHSCILTGFPGISQLSKFYYLSESTLKKEFKKVFNTTIFAHFRKLQMELAEKYMNEKKLSKKQTALMLNFSNPSNFSVCYKNYLKEKEIAAAISNIKKVSNEQYKLFVSQTPFAIAMLDDNLRYIATSEKWIKDFKLKHDVAGEYLKTQLPELMKQWQEIFVSALKEEVCEGEDLFYLKSIHDTVWLKWNIRAWYTIEKEVGGVIIYIENITELKGKTEEYKKICEVFNKTSEIARIGAWRRNIRTGEKVWNKVMEEILEAPQHSEIPFEEGINLYKSKDRALVLNATNEAINNNVPFDLEAELVTFKNHSKKVRVVGYPLFKTGKCEELFGIMQDITPYS